MMIIMSVSPLCVCLLVYFVQIANSAPSQRFSFGTVEGIDLQSQTSGTPVYAYLGIPFAEPPVGDLRFRPPVPYRGSNPSNVISSPTLRSSCMQPAVDPDFVVSDQSEDCLHLNIMVPAAQSLAPRKVMVWIHGGGYVIGDVKPYVPSDLVADYDVIVVTVQYRLGYLGFLGTADNAASGNNGLRDQVLALQWVKDNIRSFGGDADDVTVFGESAGAGSVSLLSISPYGKGLFTKAIMQSGSLLSPWVVVPQHQSIRKFYVMAELMGCLPWYHRLIPGAPVSYHERMVDCLRRLPADKFLQLPPPAPGVSRWDFAETAFATPFVDGDFVPNSPRALLRDVTYLQTNGVLDRKYLTGTTNREGQLFVTPEPEFNSDESFKLQADFASKYFFQLSTNKQMTDLIEFVYGYPRDDDGRAPVQGMIDMMTDTQFMFPTVEALTLLAQSSPTTDTYLYLFDHYPELQTADGSVSREKGTKHAMDLTFLFDQNEYTTSLTYGSLLNFNSAEALAMKDVYSGTLTQFAKTGNPSRGATGGSPAVWPRFDVTDQQYMILSPRPAAGKRVYPKRISLWQDFLPKIATNIFSRSG